MKEIYTYLKKVNTYWKKVHNHDNWKHEDKVKWLRVSRKSAVTAFSYLCWSRDRNQFDLFCVLQSLHLFVCSSSNERTFKAMFGVFSSSWNVSKKIKYFLLQGFMSSCGPIKHLAEHTTQHLTLREQVKCWWVSLSGLRQFLAIESPLNMAKNVVYFTLKVLFVLEIFKLLFIFCSWRKTA